MTKQNETNWYSTVKANWQPKAWGKFPTNDQLATAHAFGKHGKQSLALALALRDSGVTGSQIVQVCGAPQNNHRVGLIQSKLLDRVAVPKNELNHTVYKVALTAKGKAHIEAKAKAVDGTAAKAKPAKKAKAKKAKPVTVPAKPQTMLEAITGITPATVETQPQA